MSTVERISILRCLYGRAVKTFCADGTVRPYKAGKHFYCTEEPCSSLHELASILTELEHRSDRFIIRGELRDRDALARPVMRRAKGPDDDFRDAPRHWVMLDIDGVPTPPNVDSTSSEALEYVVGLLPPEFQGVSFIAQWSNSAGLKPSVIKVHLWYWLEDALGSTELRAWAKGLTPLADGRQLVDPTVYSSVQPHYTARPIFEGLSDPVPRRTLYVRLPQDTVKLRPNVGPMVSANHQVTQPQLPRASLRVAGKIIDGREQWLRNERYRILRDEEPATFSDFASAVWANFFAACEVGATSASPNTYTVHTVESKCEYDWEKYQRKGFDFQMRPSEVLAPFPERIVPLADGIEQLRNIIRDYLRKPQHTVIRVTSGAGKTATFCEELVKEIQTSSSAGEKKVAHLYLSTHKLKDEIAQRLNKLDPSLRVTNVVGRIPSTCERYGLSSSLRDLRISVQRSCCDASSSIDRELPLFLKHRRCPHFDGCSYQRQFHNPASVYLFTKPYLNAGRRSDVLIPDFVIIDEAFLSNLLEVRETGLEDILKLPKGVSEETATAVRAIRDALANDNPVLNSLRKLGYHAALLKRCAVEINDVRLRQAWQILPGMRGEEILERAARVGMEHIAFLALEAIAVEISTKREHAYSVVYRDSKLIVRFLRNSSAIQTPTLLLDATADEELIRGVLPDARYHAIEVPRKAHVVQVQNRRLSKYALTQEQGKDRTVALVQGSLDRIAAPYAKGLLVTFKSTESLFSVPPTWKTAHFGNVRGIDEYKDLDTIAIVGTYLPPIQAVEDEAAALAARLPETRVFSGAYINAERPFRLRNGEARASIWAHPDPFVQRVLEQQREAEMLQAVDRLRLVHSSSVKPVFIISNVPVDLTVDETVTLEQLAGEGDLVGPLLDHLGGAIPLKARLLHERRPDLFPTEKGAERWAAPFTPRGLISTIRPGGVKELRAKGIGQKGPNPTRVLIRGDHPAPRGLVEYLLGDLASYDGPEDREVYVHATMPQTGRVVSARVLQFVKPWIAPNGLVQMEMPPELYRVFNPPKWKERVGR